MSHHDLDFKLCAAVAHDNLVTGAVMATHPADLAELRFTRHGDIGVIGQRDGQTSGLGPDPVTTSHDRALDRGLPGLHENIVDLGNVEQLGRSRRHPYLP
jgi:hypothetical protein